MHQIETGKLKTNAVKVLNHIIRCGPCTKVEIMQSTGLQHSTSTSRITYLQDLGIIEADGSKHHGGLSYTRYKYQPDPRQQVRNAYTRKLDKFNSWMKRGKTEFADMATVDSVQLKIF